MPYIDEGMREVILPNHAPVPQNNVNAAANITQIHPRIAACLVVERIIRSMAIWVNVNIAVLL